MNSAPKLLDSAHTRQLLARTLVGTGLELGPGESPFPLTLGGATARYVDRWSTEDNARLFREVEATRFSEPNFLVDLNKDRLSAFDDESQDFVIASHILEHLVEPLGQLADIHRVLRPGGTLLIFLPDRRHTFDRARQPTPLQHLVDEYDQGVTELDEAHLDEFIQNVPEDWGDAAPPRDRAEQLDRHRQRSIHVHCWSEDEFAEVLAHQIRHMGLGWELIDRLGVDDVADGIEFGIALRRPTVPLPAEVAATRFEQVWAGLTARTDAVRSVSEQLIKLHDELDEAQDSLRKETQEKRRLAGLLDAAQTTLASHERVLGPLRKTGVMALLRRAAARVRR
ncbi:MAG: methyltransferase domain-containing protein [Dermatophilaceae bacterium]